VWVDLENTASDLEAEVRVRVMGGAGSTVFASRVALPSGSRKRVPIYVLPNNFTRKLQVQLVDPERVLLAQEVDVRPQANITFLIGLVAPERGALSIISAASWPDRTRTLELVDLSPAGLPERVEGLYSLDCLILNDVDTSQLSQEQKHALETWVRQGGRLVIGGGAGTMRTVAGLPDALLPLVPRREISLDALPGLAQFVQDKPVRVPGPFLAATGDLNDGQTLAVQENIPLIRERPVGEGYVDFVALDLVSSPFDAWNGTADFWTLLVLQHASYPSEMPPDMSPRQMRAERLIYTLSNLPSLDLPSVKSLAVLLGIYIILVGPVNYIVLRRFKRLQWAWLSIPLVTLLFSGGAFGLGYVLHGTDLILNKVAIVAAQPDGTARVNTYMGLFSPANQSYEIQVDGGGLLSPLTPYYDPFGGSNSPTGSDLVFVQGDPGSVRGLTVNQWSMQAFMQESVWSNVGSVHGDLHFENQVLVGTIQNDTELHFQDAVIVMGNYFTRLGDLAPGEKAEVHLVFSNLNESIFGPPISYRLFEEAFNQVGPGGPPRDIQVKQQILDSLLQQGGKFDPLSSVAPTHGGAALQGLTFLAWLDESPPQVTISGREVAQQATALFYTPLDYRLPQEGSLALPPGILAGQVSKMPQEGGMCGPPGMPAVYIGFGEAEFEFQLPTGIHDIRVDHLTLAVNGDGGWQGLPQVAVYNWAENAWAMLDEPTIGNNIITDTHGLIRQDGVVRLLLKMEDRRSGGCYYLGLGFEGSR